MALKAVASSTEAFLGTVTSVSVVTANGVSGSVAAPTTTPAITLTLGAITPTSVAATGTISGTTITATTALELPLSADGTYVNRTLKFTSGNQGISAFNAAMHFFANSNYQLSLNGNAVMLASSIPVSWQSTAAYTQATDLTLSRYAAKQLMISGDGTGATTNAGLILGYGGNTGNSAIWASTDTVTDQNNARIWFNSLNTVIQLPTYTGSSVISFRVAGTVKAEIFDTVGKGMTITAGSGANAATTDVQAISVTQSWNNAGVTFTAFKQNVTDSASNVASLLMDLQVGGVSKFNVSKAGNVTTGGNITPAALQSQYWNTADNSLTGLQLITATGNIQAYQQFIPKSYTVATLPTGVTGGIVQVSDQLTSPAAKGVAPTGGGSVKCLVIYNGTAWVGI